MHEDWTAPGAHVVSDGVWRIPLPLPDDGLRAVNVYAIADGDHVVMVDGGWALPHSEQALASALDDIGYGLEHISTFLVTHAHRDHYTQAAAVRRRFGTKVLLGRHERATLELVGPGAVRPELPHLRMLAEAGAVDLARLLRATWDEHDEPDDWAPPDAWLEDGTTIAAGARKLDAVHTPGHTRGHLVFHDARGGVLFSGDHVLPHITPSIGYEQVPPTSPLSEYLSSLLLVRQMPDARLLPAHGPAGQRVHQRVDELIRHHEDRLEVSLAAVQAGCASAFEVAKRLRWTRRGRALADLDPFNQMLAIIETAAHLDVLAERGHLRRAKADARVTYSVPFGLGSSAAP
jgi:glyoxylase-like metal-dependent hydrolase (beta-lactamase superfamily II)